MGKPTDTEVEMAIAEAIRLRESKKEDVNHVGKVLLNHHHRLKLLEELYRATTSFLHGESAQQHARLVKAVEAYRNYDDSVG